MATARLTRSELERWSDQVLNDHGLAVGGSVDEDAAVAAMRALAEGRGWGHATEWRDDVHRDRRWRATVYRRDAPGARAWVAGGATGMGRTESEALAIALARMLARPERARRDEPAA